MNLANRFKKIVAVGITIVLLICTMTGCNLLLPTGYGGEYPELYTEAVNSLLSVIGWHSHGDSRVKIIEEDAFGRVLFSYYDDKSYYCGEDIIGYLICQKVDETYVYYYPDYNYILNEWNHINIPFSEEEIEDLKTRNDWGKEINEEKLIKYEITRKKKDPNVKIEKKDFEALIRKVTKDHGRNVEEPIPYPSIVYLTSDSYGRMLYYVEVDLSDDSKENTDFTLAIIFNPDGTYDEATCVLELNDFYHEQDNLKEFKERNGWNQPPK